MERLRLRCAFATDRDASGGIIRRSGSRPPTGAWSQGRGWSSPAARTRESDIVAGLAVEHVVEPSPDHMPNPPPWLPRSENWQPGRTPLRAGQTAESF
jgi:hypothetical protein